MFSFKVDGILLWSIVNKQPVDFYNVKMYLGDPWYPALDASVKELTVRSWTRDID